MKALTMMSDLCEATNETISEKTLVKLGHRTKTLTIEGQISNCDGIMFIRQLDTVNRKEYIEAVFYTEFTTELFNRIQSSGVDQCKPAKVTITVEQDDG